MKKLSKLTLRSMESKELSEKQMDQVKGGWNSCGCGCCYSTSGGSSDIDNGQANCRRGLNSYECSSDAWATWGCN